MEKKGSNLDILEIYKNTTKRCVKFMDEDNLKVQTTNIQEIYNHYQHYSNDLILVLDFRSKKLYENCHIIDSINIPLDGSKITDFILFKEANFLKQF